jgi:hypothetical protein
MKGLIDLIANIGFKGTHKQARDSLGRVYEYFLGKFAQAEGKLGGEIDQERQDLESYKHNSPLKSRRSRR